MVADSGLLIKNNGDFTHSYDGQYGAPRRMRFTPQGSMRGANEGQQKYLFTGNLLTSSPPVGYPGRPALD
jgi:hypothetical protein